MGHRNLPPKEEEEDYMKGAIEDDFLSAQMANFGINGVYNLRILSSMRPVDQLVK
jgi:hypothetical protein